MNDVLRSCPISSQICYFRAARSVTRLREGMQMAQTQALVTALKHVLKSRGITYLEGTGRLTGKASASSPTERGRRASSSKMARRVGSPKSPSPPSP